MSGVNQELDRKDLKEKKCIKQKKSKQRIAGTWANF